MFNPFKYRAMAQQLAATLEDARQLLELERTKRIAAETLAEERLKQCERAYEIAFRADNARNEAVTERLKSVDLVNTKLLESMGPEKAETRRIQDFKPVAKQNLQAVSVMRNADRKFLYESIKKEQQRQKAKQSPSSTLQ